MRKEVNSAVEASSMHIYIRYMLKNMPPSRERGHQPMSIGGKYGKVTRNRERCELKKEEKGKFLLKG
jgi:hypothetical protein